MKWNTVQAKPICIFFFSQLASNEMPNVKITSHPNSLCRYPNGTHCMAEITWGAHDLGNFSGDDIFTEINTFWTVSPMCWCRLGFLKQYAFILSFPIYFATKKKLWLSQRERKERKERRKNPRLSFLHKFSDSYTTVLWYWTTVPIYLCVILF